MIMTMMMMMVETQNSINHIALQCQSWYMGNKEFYLMTLSVILFARWRLSNWRWAWLWWWWWWWWWWSCLPDDDCQIEDGVTGYWWRHATITEIDLTNQFLSYFSILSTFIIIQSIFSMPSFEVVNHTLKYLNIKVGSLRDFWGCEICGTQKDVSYFFLFFSTKLGTKHTTSLA